ncbi:hypothetical protein I4U23_010272 [Adineta vaga]|nr:hypothetical protein I4U23_010272 [Adineta vaga]
MSKSKVIFLGLLFSTALILLFNYYNHYDNPHSLFISELPKISILSIELPPCTVPLYKYQLVEMDDRSPIYTLATQDGDKPFDEGYFSQANLVDNLKLIEACSQDPSLIVVDIGSLLGDFGLYAAACGCQVYIFEIQPNSTDLIRASILANNFSTERVHVIQRAVTNIPSNSDMTFAIRDGRSNITKGTIRTSTVRLDDIDWPPSSSILLLKIDVSGFELNVLRSAKKLFRAKRIQHVILEYTAWWTDRAAQKDVIPYLQKTLGAKGLYALERLGRIIYGPLNTQAVRHFYDYHVNIRLQTDIYAKFIETNGSSTFNAEPYYLGVSRA